MEIKQLKTTISEIKNSVNVFTIEEERIDEFEDRSIEIRQTGSQKEKEWRKTLNRVN